MRRTSVVCAAVVLTIACGVTMRVGIDPPPPIGRPTSIDPVAERQLLIVLDGLRPDYVTPDLMPNLHALGERGAVFTNHHSVYPTVTRVNAASVSTGAYPDAHGLLGNSVFFPGVDPSRFLSTSDKDNLRRIEASESTGLLTAPTLGERLQLAGARALVVSAGSTGSSYLLNHRVAGGGIIHYDYALPASLEVAVRARLGAAPPADTPNDARNRYVVDAFFQVGLPRVDPAVTLMWLSEPDASAHAHGIGHPTSNASLRGVDAEIGRIQDELRAAGLFDDVNIWVTSDHGFSTHTGGVDIEAVLAPFAGTLDDGTPRVVAGAGAIYVRDGDRDTIVAIVEALQREERVGAIFTREGRVPGTLSFDHIRWNHARAADILFSPAWSDEANAFGYAGTTASAGVAGHGSSSPRDIHNTLIAAGPDVKSGIRIASPSANVDFAPTFLFLLGIDAPPTMQGRVLREALNGGRDDSDDWHTELVAAETADGRYRVSARMTVLGRHRYLDQARVERRR